MGYVEIKIATGTTIEYLEREVNRIAHIRDDEINAEIEAGYEPSCFAGDSFVPCGSISFVNEIYTLPMIRTV